MDTVRQHFGLLSFGYLAYFLCYGAVGKQHKLFYQFISIFGFLKVNADGFSFFIDFEFHFVTVEVDGSCREAFFAQSLGYGVEHQYLVLEVTLFGFDDLLRLFVSEAAVRFDDRVYNARVSHFSFFRDIEYGRESKFLFVGAKRADEVAEPFGQL